MGSLRRELNSDVSRPSGSEQQAIALQALHQATLVRS